MISPYYDYNGISIYNGDCLSILPDLDVQVDCVIGDPPFNTGKNYGSLTNDNRSLDDYKLWLANRIRASVSVGKPGSSYWFMNETANLAFTQNIMEDAGLNFENIIVWAYGNPIPSSNRLPKTWRPILFMRKPGENTTWDSDGDQYRRDTVYCNLSRMKGKRQVNDLWPDIPKLVGGIYAQKELLTDSKGKFIHIAQMPELIVERILLLCTKPGDLILDPFMGSGTVLRVAKNMGRCAIGIEIEEKYCNEAVMRLAQEPLNLFS